MTSVIILGGLFPDSFTPWTVVSEYLGIAIFFVLAGAVVATFVALASVLGPKKPSQPKLEPFECGEVPFALPAGRFPVKFYLTAILFILFDVELVFLPVGRSVSRSRCVGPR